MTDTCDHCGGELGADRVEGRDGEYCPGTCCYDAEALGVDPDELPPRPPVGDVFEG